MTKNKKKIRKKRPPPTNKRNRTIVVVGKNNKLKKFKVTKEEMFDILEHYIMEMNELEMLKMSV